MEAISNISVLFIKTFVKVCLFSVFILEKKFGMDVASGFCVHILSRTERER